MQLRDRVMVSRCYSGGKKARRGPGTCISQTPSAVGKKRKGLEEEGREHRTNPTQEKKAGRGNNRLRGLYHKEGKKERQERKD